MSYSPIDIHMQNFVRQGIHPIILHLANNLTLATYKGELRLYDTLRPEYYRPDMSTDVYEKFLHCQDWPQVGTEFKYQFQQQLIPQSGLLEFIAADIFRLLLQAQPGSLFLAIITDRYIKLSYANPTPTISSPRVAHIFLNHSIILYRVPDIILSDNGPQFVSNLLFYSPTISALRISTTAHDPQTNGQVEGYNSTLL